MSSMLMSCNGGNTSPVPVDLTQGQVAHYLFNNNADDSYGTHDGTSTNGVDFQGDCAEFNGVDNFASTKITNSLFHAVSFWAFIGYDGAINGRTTFGNGNMNRRIHISSYVNSSNQPTVYIQWRDGTGSGFYNYQNYHSTSTTPNPKGEWIHFYVERQVGTRYDRVFCNGVECVLGSFLYDGDTSKEFYDEIDMGYVTLNIENTFYAGQASNVRFYSDSKDQAFIDALYAEGYYPKPLPLPTIDGLVAQYPLTGTAEDTTGTYNGTELGGVIYEDNPQFGSVFKGDGTSRYIDIPSLGFDVANGFTVSIWYRNLSGTTYARYIVQNLDGTGIGRSLIFINQTTGKLATFVGGALIDSSFTDTLGTWYHVILTYNSASNELKMDVNGTNVLTTIVAGESNIAGFRIAAHKDLIANNLNYLYGNARFANFYSRVLSAQEKIDLHNYEKNFRPIDIDDGLVAYYPLANNSLDNYHNQYDGVDNGTVSFNGIYCTTATISDYISSNVTALGNVFSFSIWHNSTLSVDNMYLFDNRTGTRSIIATSYSSNHNYAIFTNGTWYPFSVSSETIEMTLVTIVIVNTSASLYINGQFQETISISLFYLDGNIRLGESAYNQNFAKGRIYNKRIIPEQVQVIYNTEKGDFGL